MHYSSGNLAHAVVLGDCQVPFGLIYARLGMTEPEQLTLLVLSRYMSC